MASQSALFAQHIDQLQRWSAACLAQTGFEQMLIAAGRISYRFLDDREIPFVANPHFKWWVPVVDNPNCLLQIKPGEKPRLYYSIPQDYWYQSAAEPDGFWTESIDVQVFDQADEIEALLPRGQQVALIGDDSIAPLATRLGCTRNPDALIHRLHWHRATKTDYELTCLAQANHLGARAHQAAEHCWRAGGSEYQAHMAYLKALQQTDEELPYHSIVAAGSHGAVLHYQNRDRTTSHQSALAFLIDAGASAAGYASDITRTYAGQQGTFSDLIVAMEKLQLQIAAAVVPGTAFPDLHRQTHQLLAELMVDCGIARLTAQQVLDEGITRAFFPHGLGHFLGLQVHDVGGHQGSPEGDPAPPPAEHPFLRLTRTLEAGHVVTIEPGLYCIPMLLEPLRKKYADGLDWALVDELTPYGGIRIEDNVVATEQGADNLTRAAFNALAADG